MEGFFKNGFRDYVFLSLNDFHDNITFTFEEERNNIFFLDVLLIRKQDGIDLAVFRKETNTDHYINWNVFAPETWKMGTLKMLIRRAFKVCTKDYFLEMKLYHLETTFVETNNFPHNVVKRIFKQVPTKMNDVPNSATNNATEENAVEHKVVQCSLPYAGEKGEYIVKEVNKKFKKLKRHNLKTLFAFKGMIYIKIKDINVNYC